MPSDPISYEFDHREANELNYIQDFFLGTPPQELHQILIDTGSSDLILFKSDFNHEKSTSIINITNEFTGLYGSIDLFEMAETKDIVTSPLNGLILQNKTFGLADVGVLLEEFDAENGILGLVYTRTEFVRPIYNNFTYLLKEQGKIKRILFAINGQPNAPPSIIFGGLHAGVYEDHIYFNIDSFESRLIALDVQGLQSNIKLTDLIQDEKVVDGVTYVAIPRYSVYIGINADAGTLPGLLLKQWCMVWKYDNHQMHLAKYKPVGEQVEAIIEVLNGYELPVATQDAPKPMNTYTEVYLADLETTIAVAKTTQVTSSELESIKENEFQL